MGIDISELYREELASLNHAVALFGIPDEVFREYGLSYLSIAFESEAEFIVGSRRGTGTAISPELIFKDSNATTEFERLCLAVPHIPRSSLSFLSLAYGAFLVATQNAEDMSGLKSAGGSQMLSLQALMSIVETRSLAIGHAGLSEGKLKIVQGFLERQKIQTTAAARRHKENRSMKIDVFAWLDANMSNFSSMDAAAEAIAGKVAPIKFRTARDWIDQWRKLRSPGTS